MMLLHIINKTMLEDNIKSIINFISRPILSINKNRDDVLESFYQAYTNEELDKFSNEIYQFTQKPDKNLMDQKILNISNKKLNFPNSLFSLMIFPLLRNLILERRKIF